MELSIVITSFQRPHLLQWGLLSLSRQHLPFEYEIIVVNDGIEDDTEKICKSFPTLPIKYVFTGQRNIPNITWRVAGFAINVGVKQAQGKNIILSCAEMFLIDNCIEQMVERLNACSKFIVITDGRDDEKRSFLNEVIQTGGNPNLELYPTLSPLNTEFPFFMGLNRQEVLNIGGYDEDLIGYSWDDKDFADRLLWNGGKIIKFPSRVVHLYHERNTNRPGIPMPEIPKLVHYNQNLYNVKKGTIVRNVGRDWGKI